MLIQYRTNTKFNVLIHNDQRTTHFSHYKKYSPFWYLSISDSLFPSLVSIPSALDPPPSLAGPPTDCTVVGWDAVGFICRAERKSGRAVG